MLGNYTIRPMLPASDLERAKIFYKEKLGLTPVEENPGAADYVANGVSFSVYPTQFAGTAQNTAVEFVVDDLEKLVDELTAKGVTFEQYDFGEELRTNEKGIAELGPNRGAWFKDSEANIIGLRQP